MKSKNALLIELEKHNRLVAEYENQLNSLKRYFPEWKIRKKAWDRTASRKRYHSERAMHIKGKLVNGEYE